jgi:acyl-CoA synthetase (NDP forming)
MPQSLVRTHNLCRTKERIKMTTTNDQPSTRINPTEAIRALTNPRSVAIIGASSDEEKFAGQPLRNLIQGGFDGEIYPVNPRGGVINGIPVLRDVSELPVGVDVAFVIIPADRAVEAVSALGDASVRTAVVAVSGFAEAGTEGGKTLQEELRSAGVRHGIRIVGPNTNGIYNAAAKVSLGYNYVHSTRLRPGSVGLISHSGAMLGGFLPLLEAYGQGISTFISCGNEVDLKLTDYARYLLDDPQTNVIALILDGVENGSEFKQLAEEAQQRGKALVVLKLGNSDAGNAATQAHSSRLAGSSESYQAIFDAYGIISLPTLETLALGCALLAQRRSSHLAGVVVTSTSGAGAILLADVLTDAGVPLTQLTPVTVRKLKEHGGFAQAINPFDNGAAGPTNAMATFMALADDKGTGAFISYLNPLNTANWRKAVAEATVEVSRRHTALPVMVISPAPLFDDEESIYAEARIPVVRSTLDALAVVSALTPGSVPNSQNALSESEPRENPQTSGTSLSEPDSKNLLTAFGLRFPREQLCHTEQDAEAAAHSLGYPLVLKAAGSSIAHKTEHALVAVGVGAEDLIPTFRQLTETGRQLDPEGFQGVIVAEQVPEGVEAVLGVKVDQDFGPMVLVGAGGILTELINDVALIPVPFTREEAIVALSKTKLSQLLDGYRGGPKLDRDALIDQMLSLAEAAVAMGDDLEAIDLNPVRVLPKAAIALDALVIRRPNPVA